MSDENRVNIEKAAEHFGVSTKTIRRWIKSGKLSADKAYKGKGYEYAIRIPEYNPAEPAERKGDEWLDIMDRTPGQSGIDTGPSRAASLDNLTLALSAKDELIQHLRDEIAEKNRQIGEILLVLRQTQALLPEGRRKRRWWQPGSWFGRL